MKYKILTTALSLLMATSTYAEDESNSAEDRKSITQTRVAIVRELADDGKPTSQLELGNYYFHGVPKKESAEHIIPEEKIRVPQDYNLAVFWYKKAANQENGRAQFNLGICYDLGLGIEKDSTKALEYYILAAENKEGAVAAALLNAALMLQKENKVEDALTYFLKAGEKGILLASRKAGLILLTRKDKLQKKEGFGLLLAAAVKGDIESQFIVANCYRQGAGVDVDKKQLVRWLWKAVEAGHPRAQFQMGNFCERGTALARDGRKARILYQRSSKQGYAPAHAALGMAYLVGIGGPQDYKEAFACFRTAADQDFVEGYFLLGSCHAAGYGVVIDVKKAFTYFEIAAKRGHRRAQFNLGLFYKNGTGVKQSYFTAVDWFTKAAEQKDPEALASLGECYMTGLGVPKKDLKKAEELLKEADLLGSTDATYLLNKLKENK